MMSGIKTHKDLDVWKEAMTLVKQVYKLTANLDLVYNLIHNCYISVQCVKDIIAH
jgi:hypothetical protein